LVVGLAIVGIAFATHELDIPILVSALLMGARIARSGQYLSARALLEARPTGRRTDTRTNPDNLFR